MFFKMIRKKNNSKKNKYSFKPPCTRYFNPGHLFNTIFSLFLSLCFYFLYMIHEFPQPPYRVQKLRWGPVGPCPPSSAPGGLCISRGAQGYRPPPSRVQKLRWGPVGPGPPRSAPERIMYGVHNLYNWGILANLKENYWVDVCLH